jgi:hypothetical protein
LNGHEELRAIGEEDSGKGKTSYKHLSLHEWKHAEFVDMSEFVDFTNAERANEMKKALVGSTFGSFSCRSSRIRVIP